MTKEPPTIASALFYLLLAFTLVGFGWAYYMPVEQSIAARGQVSFLGEPQSISAGQDGIVEKVLVHTSTQVHNGQVVMTYHPEINGTDQGKAEKQEVYLQESEVGILMWQRDLLRGDSIREGERLAVVYPATPVGIKVTLPDRELGRVKPGMKVRILLEAYPYQHYGAIYGSVTDIQLQANPAMGRELELVVLIGLDELPNEAIKLRPGLMASVEIITGKTSLLKEIIMK